jgi:hypothetical protein
MSLSPPWNSDMHEMFLSKDHWDFTGRKSAWWCVSNTDCFCRDKVVSSTQLRSLAWNKMNPSPLRNYDLQEVFLLKTNSVLSGKRGARCFCFKHWRFIIERQICLDISGE